MRKEVMQQVLDALELRAEYDDTYPPRTRPLNDCAIASQALREELDRKIIRPINLINLLDIVSERFQIGQNNDGHEIAMIPPSVWIGVKNNVKSLYENWNSTTTQ